MKKRFTEEQIIKAFKEHSGGRQTADIVRELGVFEQMEYARTLKNHATTKVAIST